MHIDHPYTWHLNGKKITGFLKGISKDKKELFFMVNLDGEWQTMVVSDKDFIKTNTDKIISI